MRAPRRWSSASRSSCAIGSLAAADSRRLRAAEEGLRHLGGVHAAVGLLLHVDLRAREELAQLGDELVRIPARLLEGADQRRRVHLGGVAGVHGVRTDLRRRALRPGLRVLDRLDLQPGRLLIAVAEDRILVRLAAEEVEEPHAAERYPAVRPVARNARASSMNGASTTSSRRKSSARSASRRSAPSEAT